MDPKSTEVDVWLSEDGTVQAIGHLVGGGPFELSVRAIPGPMQTVTKARVRLDEIQGKTRIRLDPDSGELEAD
jgi:hypothetical protein